MILRSYYRDLHEGIENNYEELVKQYPDIKVETDTPIGKEYHYNQLQQEDYFTYLNSLGKKVSKFYNRFKKDLTEGECWRTCYFFCFNTDPNRYVMCEGYYEGLQSLYHFVVKDTETGRLIDPHFDLIGETISKFDITKEMTIHEYQDQFVEEEIDYDDEYENLVKKIKEYLVD